MTPIAIGSGEAALFSLFACRALHHYISHNAVLRNRYLSLLSLSACEYPR